MVLPLSLAARLAPLQARWQAMPLRDRRAFAALSLFLGAVLLWLAIIAPAFRFAANAHERLGAARADFSWMTGHASEARQAAQSAARGLPAGQSLMAVVSSSAGQAGINLQRFEPDGAQRVRVSIENAAFTDVMRWVVLLEQQYGLRVSAFTADAVAEPGIANIRLTVGP